ncbi:hypothetical protein [Kitasatospora sp. NBC_01266]|uniref:hypothetical protein n=1 Tax=Kitasatospora sp. NBC_01266 TaxID=2903572 RepID=UPI002E31BB2D|nr:hypothetical protein [Kitasatospora sp. NBC_01266]
MKLLKALHSAEMALLDDWTEALGRSWTSRGAIVDLLHRQRRGRRSRHRRTPCAARPA